MDAAAIDSIVFGVVVIGAMVFAYKMYKEL